MGGFYWFIHHIPFKPDRYRLRQYAAGHFADWTGVVSVCLDAQESSPRAHKASLEPVRGCHRTSKLVLEVLSAGSGVTLAQRFYTAEGHTCLWGGDLEN